MAITTRDELIEALALVGVVGLARQGELDALLGSGEVVIPDATTSTVGGVRKAVTVTNVGSQTVADIEVAQTSINLVATKLNELLTALRNAGVVTA